MLTPTQVLPFLTHPDADVREQAANYFTQLGHAAPPETADALWQAIDRVGNQRSEMGLSQSLRFINALAEVPLDDSSITRAIALLTSPADVDQLFAVETLIKQQPTAVLQRRKDKILPVAKDPLRRWMEQRFSLESLPAQEIWQQLVQLAEKSGQTEDETSEDDIDYAQADALVKALTRHPDFVIPLAMSVLQDPQERWWLETWCAELLGQFRHTPAIDLLIEEMEIEDADILRQTAAEALARMDAVTVVPKLEAAYPTDNPFDRMSISEVLGKIKDPLSESALIRLLPGENDKNAVSGICTALCDLCTTEGLELLRQAVLADRYDPMNGDLKEQLVTLARMTGFDPPELPEWKTQLADPLYKQKRRDGFLAAMGMSEPAISRFRQALEMAAKAKSDQPVDSQALLSPPPVATPYRREAPKVGRNDPCPCGSGKKYKKCCGA